MMIADRESAETVDAAAPAVTVNVKTYTPTPAPESKPSTSCATRLVAAIPPVKAPVSALTVPDTFVWRIRSRTAVPEVPTVNAAQPDNLIPDTTAISENDDSVSVAMTVSVAAAGEASTVVYVWIRFVRSKPIES